MTETIQPTALRKRRNEVTWISFALLALLVVAAFNLIVSYAAALHSANRAIIGLTHIDLLVYYACARETWDARSLFYASPYSSLAESPRIYTHFAFLVIGLVWRGLGLSVYAADQLLRLVFGTVMLFMSSAVVRCALPASQRDKPIALAGCVLVICGGGIAWLAGLWQLLFDWITLRLFSSDKTPLFAWLANLPEAIVEAESGYGEWGASPVRVLFSAAECIYHVLFFGCVLALLRGHRAAALVLLILTWWSHPFSGVMLGSIVIVFLSVRSIRDRSNLLYAVAAVVMQVLFLGYYLVYLPRFAEHASVNRELQAFGASMLFTKMLPAYGLFLLLPLLAAKSWGRSLCLADPATLLMTAWLVCELLLMFHDRVVRVPMQPMHFTRGYLYIPLVYFSVRALHEWPKLVSKRSQWISAILLLAIHSPDTVLYLARFAEYLKLPRIEFSVDKDVVACLEKMDEIPGTMTIHVLNSAMLPGAEGLIPVFTHHRALSAHTFNVPFVAEKNEYGVGIETDLAGSVPGRFGLDALIVGADAARELTAKGLASGPPVALDRKRFLVRIAHQ